MDRSFGAAEARRFYDRVGHRQDSQAFYEDPALERLIANGRFGEALAVVELGCGTGRLARTLLAEHMQDAATYRAFDISPVMVALAAERLAGFGGRAVATLVEGGMHLPMTAGAADRVVSTYVLDLLPDGEIDAALTEAARLLGAGGLLCVAGITPGTTFLSRVVMGGWATLRRLRPSLVGGCRPVRVAARLDPATWEIKHASVIVAFGVASEVVVARRIGGSRH